MGGDLNRLRIDKTMKSQPRASKWATRWILAGITLFVLLGIARVGYTWATAATEVELLRVRAEAGNDPATNIVLNATGYIVAAHKIQVASKVVGRVAFIGVDKGDKVREGDVLVRLEDDEYQAQLRQARGSVAALEARLLELLNGSRPEEIATAKANWEQAKADLQNAEVTLGRTRRLVKEGVQAQQLLDDAEARFAAQQARVASLEKTYELVRIGPRQELIQQVRGQLEQARGAVAFAETALKNTVIRAPVTGTILERVVEKGEFVTTSFVGDRGAKGFVVSLADLNDLEVELDINQNDFAKLRAQQKGIVTTDAYPDRRYDGVIDEISPEANRQKATVQVKVKVQKPDDFLRPEMNASVAFVGAEKAASSKPVVFVPTSAVRDGKVFVIEDGKAAVRAVKIGANTPKGLRIEEGLNGGEEIIVNAPANLKAGEKVKPRGSARS
jgi:HlyD family secretion protein